MGAHYDHEQKAWLDPNGEPVETEPSSWSLYGDDDY